MIRNSNSIHAHTITCYTHTLSLYLTHAHTHTLIALTHSVQFINTELFSFHFMLMLLFLFFSSLLLFMFVSVFLSYLKRRFCLDDCIQFQFNACYQIINICCNTTHSNTFTIHTRIDTHEHTIFSVCFLFTRPCSQRSQYDIHWTLYMSISRLHQITQLLYLYFLLSFSLKTYIVFYNNDSIVCWCHRRTRSFCDKT